MSAKCLIGHGLSLLIGSGYHNSRLPATRRTRSVNEAIAMSSRRSSNLGAFLADRRMAWGWQALEQGMTGRVLLADCASPMAIETQEDHVRFRGTSVGY